MDDTRSLTVLDRLYKKRPHQMIARKTILKGHIHWGDKKCDN